MSADHDRDPRSIRRAVAALGLVVIMASLLVLLMDAGRARGFAADRDRRAREIEAREPELYRQLAHRDSLLESQRQVYMERFRRLEAQIRRNDHDIAALRARLNGITTRTVDIQEDTVRRRSGP